MHKKVIRCLSLVVLLWVLGMGSANAQLFNTIYWMRGIPQASYANPALMPDARFYLGMPAASSHYTGFSHSGFALQDFLRKDAMDNFYWDEDHMINSLQRNNLLNGGVQHEFFALGWRKNANYYSFAISENVLSAFAYPRDFMTLMIKGNDHFRELDRAADFSGLAMDAMHYRQISAGFAREWEAGFAMGLRGKALFGMGNVWFERSNMSLYTHPDHYGLLLNADLMVHTSLPVSLSPIDSLGADTEFDFNERDYLLNTRNMGVALDAGFSWKPFERMTLAASVLDIGFIDWKEGVENFRLQGEFEFDGIDINDFRNGNDDDDFFQNLVDSIRDIFDIDETVFNYRTPLNTKIFLSAAFDLSPRHTLGLLARGEIYRSSMYPSYTFSYNFKPGRAFALTMAYSIIHNNYHNVGAGMHLNMGPLQLYVAGDNFFGVMQPHTVQTANLHLGLNWVFGYRPKKEADRPLFSW
jgi:hypothetical protein